MLINGDDGLNNTRNCVYLNWLFNMNSGYEIFKGDYLDSSFEESIFIIEQESFRCFISDKIYKSN